MVAPRLRSNSNIATAGDLSLPHAYGGGNNNSSYVSNGISSSYDPDCKTSKASTVNTLKRQMKILYYQSIKPNEKQIMLFLGIVFGLYLFVNSGLSIVFATNKYPWKNHIRSAALFNLPFSDKRSKIYKIPDSSKELGDKTDFYAKLRQLYDKMYPTDTQRSLEVVQQKQVYNIEPFHAMKFLFNDNPNAYYDIYNCPDNPPDHYPINWKLMEILLHWPADDPYPTERIYQSLCVFDYRKDYDKAMRYRDAELPFVLKNDPAVAKTVERWHQPNYLSSLIGHVNHDVEFSTTNHFLSWSKEGKHPKDWKPPTKWMEMRYKEWLTRANVKPDKLGPDMPHWQFRISGCRETNPSCMKVRADYVWDELPFYQPKFGNLYVKDPKWQKSVHCKFGMQGVIEENHFHAESQFYTMVAGQRRFVISPPSNCKNFALYPEDHPSKRYGKINWSNPDVEENPEFKDAVGNEVVLQAGDSLYLPSVWFHHVISLSLNVECSTKSGFDTSHFDDIEKCGYHII